MAYVHTEGTGSTVLGLGSQKEETGGVEARVGVSELSVADTNGVFSRDYLVLFHVDSIVYLSNECLRLPTGSPLTTRRFSARRTG